MLVICTAAVKIAADKLGSKDTTLYKKYWDMAFKLDKDKSVSESIVVYAHVSP